MSKYPTPVPRPVAKNHFPVNLQICLFLPIVITATFDSGILPKLVAFLKYYSYPINFVLVSFFSDFPLFEQIGECLWQEVQAALELQNGRHRASRCN